MREVHVHRADPIVSTEPVEPVLIRIEREQPLVPYGDPGYTEAAKTTFATDAKALADALHAACPGGTVDALLAELLSRRASMFRVPFNQGR